MVRQTGREKVYRNIKRPGKWDSWCVCACVCVYVLCVRVKPFYVSGITRHSKVCFCSVYSADHRNHKHARAHTHLLAVVLGELAVHSPPLLRLEVP